MPLLHRASLVVFADYFQFYIANGGANWSAPEDWSDDDLRNGGKVTESVVAIAPASNMDVPVEVEVFTEEQTIDLGSFDHAFSCSLRLETGHLQLHECTGPERLFLSVSAGDYQVVVLFSGLEQIGEHGLAGKGLLQDRPLARLTARFQSPQAMDRRLAQLTLRDAALNAAGWAQGRGDLLTIRSPDQNFEAVLRGVDIDGSIMVSQPYEILIRPISNRPSTPLTHERPAELRCRILSGIDLQHLAPRHPAEEARAAHVRDQLGLHADARRQHVGMDALEVRARRHFDADMEVARPGAIAVAAVLDDDVELVLLDDATVAEGGHRETEEMLEERGRRGSVGGGEAEVVESGTNRCGVRGHCNAYAQAGATLLRRGTGGVARWLT